MKEQIEDLQQMIQSLAENVLKDQGGTGLSDIVNGIGNGLSQDLRLKESMNSNE